MVLLDLPEFLKADDVHKSEPITVEIMNEGTYRDFEYKGEPRRVFEVLIKKSDGKEIKWSMNMTTQKAIAEKYGRDTAKWVGRKIGIEKVKQNIAGTIRDVLYGVPV